MHNQLGQGVGTIAAAVAITASPAVADGSPQKEALQSLAKMVAMHIAAAKPSYLSRSSVPADALERERAVLLDQARQSGKPDAILNKMVEGKLSKFYAQHCLEEQPCLIGEENADKKVSAVVSDQAKKLGLKSASIVDFELFVLGQAAPEQQRE